MHHDIILFDISGQHLPAILIVRVVDALAPQHLIGLDQVVASGKVNIVDNATLRARLHGIAILAGASAVLIKAMLPAIST
jgi:hypothetical protein